MIVNRLKNIIRAEIEDMFENSPDFKNFFNKDEIGPEDYTSFKEEETAYEQTYSSFESNQASNQELSKEREYYQALEIPYGSPFDVVKKAYRKLMKMYHPDLYHGDEEKHKVALEISRKINEAYVYFEEKFGK